MFEMSTFMIARRVEVAHPADVATARRVAMGIGTHVGMPEDQCSDLAIVVTELAQNLVRHAGSGEVLLAPTSPDPGLDVIAVDRGDGIADLARAQADGFSTAGTAGNGLGAARRQSSRFDLWSVPGKGTIAHARVYVRPQWRRRVSWPGPEGAPLEAARLCVPCPGHAVSGDVGWILRDDADRWMFVLIDVLGHGVNAAEEAADLCRTGTALGVVGPADLLAVLHEADVGRRGAVGAAVRIDLAARRFEAAVVGNISLALPQGRIAGTPGVLGRPHKPLRQQGDFGPDDWLVMHSDGIRTRWPTEDLVERLQAGAGVASAWLYRDWSRPTDDASVLAARPGRPMFTVPSQ